MTYTVAVGWLASLLATATNIKTLNSTQKDQTIYSLIDLFKNIS